MWGRTDPAPGWWNAETPLELGNAWKHLISLSSQIDKPRFHNDLARFLLQTSASGQGTGVVGSEFGRLTHDRTNGQPATRVYLKPHYLGESGRIALLGQMEFPQGLSIPMPVSWPVGIRLLARCPRTTAVG